MNGCTECVNLDCDSGACLGTGHTITKHTQYEDKEKGSESIMIDNDEALDVANAMRIHGGSFVSALGEAIIHADPINRQKIHDTWPEYWKQYKKIAKSLKDK